MSTRPKIVPALSAEERAALERAHLHGATARQRQRAHAVLLSAQGYRLDQLAEILRADRDTVSGWLDAWRREGLGGLADAPRPGRPRKLGAALEAELRDLLEHPTPDLRALVQAHLQKRGSGSPGRP